MESRLIAFRAYCLLSEHNLRANASRIAREDRFILPDLALSNSRALGRLCGPQRAKLFLELYLLQQRVGEQFTKSNILALQVLEHADLFPGRQSGKAGRIDF